MAEFDITEIKVCVVCMHLMCNGEYNDGTDAAEKCAERQDLVWGGNQKYFTPGFGCDSDCDRDQSDESHECTEFDQGFSWTSCDGCEDTLGGDRYLAYVMIPKTGVEA